MNILFGEYNLEDAIRVAKEETREETRKETWEEAEKIISERKERQFARKLLASGMSIEQVARLTELSVEKVTALANNRDMVHEDAGIYDAKKR